MPKQAEIFLGRLQPIHNGHKKIIGGMKNPVVVLIKGKKSSQDKKKNPLDAAYQIKLIKMIAPKADVYIAATGYVPSIIADIKAQFGYDITKVHAGTDRVAGYRKQIDAVNKKADADPGIARIDAQVVEVKRGDDDVSATKVRDAIKSDDLAAFKKLVPAAIYGEWNTLKTMLNMANESFYIMGFNDWLTETTVVTGDIAKIDPPLFSREKKKKMMEEGCPCEEEDDKCFEEYEKKKGKK